MLDERARGVKAKRGEASKQGNGHAKRGLETAESEARRHRNTSLRIASLTALLCLQELHRRELWPGVGLLLLQHRDLAALKEQEGPSSCGTVGR